MSDTTSRIDVPQDERVSRRWFLDRMAWASSATAMGSLLSRVPVWASSRGPVVTAEAFATDVRLQSVSDLTTLSMSESMSLMRAGTLAPTDLVNAYVDRIEAFDGIYEAYADRPDREDLLAQLDATPDDEQRSPLRGM